MAAFAVALVVVAVAAAIVVGGVVTFASRSEHKSQEHKKQQ